MKIESIPKFTRPTAKLWATVPAHVKKLLLSNVWRVHCSHSVTITDFTGTVKGGDLVLEGLCSECRGDVARVVEMGYLLHQLKLFNSKQRLSITSAIHALCPSPSQAHLRVSA